MASTEDEAIRSGGKAEDVIKAISGNDSTVVSTEGRRWGILPEQQHEYTDDEWDTIEEAVESGKPVIASTGGGDFGDGDQVTALADTNDDGVLLSKDEDEGVTVGEGLQGWRYDYDPDKERGSEPDEEGDYRIVGGNYRMPDTRVSHAYTVVAIDDETVTLYNPWGRNDTADGYTPPPEDQQDGYIRIPRADYENYFSITTIEDDEE